MDLARYSRQVLFEPIGEDGQRRLSNSTVLVVGAGALGTVICNHLVRAGIGKVRLIDRDYVEMSNLQRQMLFDEDDVKCALPKAVAAGNKLEKMNSQVIIEPIVGNVSVENIDDLINDANVVLDGTDNFSTRYLLNDACFKYGIPFSYGGVVSSRGMTAFFIPEKTPCLRCITKQGEGGGETCDTVGVISPAVDMISSFQVTETLKYLTGNQQVLRQTLKTFDVWHNRQYDMKLSHSDPECVVCQKQEFPALQKKAQSEETVLCGRDTVQIHRKSVMDLEQWESKLGQIADTKRTPFLLKASLQEGIHFVMFTDGRVLVQGTEDPIQARTLYDRYIGS
ncbi:thiamine/molybdopterin biosynthesis protein MoeB [Lentibacillus kapialis]|uniref:Thiamine/molybdopterin biosynthesis protein MoeB n=1 Tax=Lentibacillus kapialis TaxID=340214 RepID=A0A917Q041_9BACI|nr:ThiF family adenylyltransferase [Lentibacillus kapialis]GGK03343.1 thiamine/molybdopterin biosynthesis protein MoeB [Lentibacillus kapialis]